MVRVTVERASDGGISGFKASGHTGCGTAGQDIVCAAVSALTQTAVLGLQDHLGIAVALTAGPGLLQCRLPAGVPDASRLRAQDILETMCLGLEAVAAQRPRAIRLRGARPPARGQGDGDHDPLGI